MKRRDLILLMTVWAYAQNAWADAQTTIDPGFYTSARAGALAGAISGTANGLDAAFWNPALIGGMEGAKQNVRNLHLPYFGVSYNSNTQNLKSRFDSQGGDTNPKIGEAIVNSSKGTRQYGRFSSGIDIEWKRLLLNGFVDLQAAALSPSDRSPDPITGETIVALKYHETAGGGVGFSWMNAKNTFSIGWYGAALQVKDLEGEIPYLQLIDSEKRGEYFDSQMNKYSALLNHLGLWYRIPNALNPTFSIVARNPGDARLKNKSASSRDATIKEDWVVGFGLQPKLGPGVLSWNTDFSRTSEHEESLRSKMATSLEYSLGGIGSNAAFAIRSGLNQAGLSAGLGMSLGILNLDVASAAVNIGDINDRISERRTSVVLSVNVREP
jgi:hypothetical protein